MLTLFIVMLLVNLATVTTAILLSRRHYIRKNKFDTDDAYEKGFTQGQWDGETNERNKWLDKLPSDY